MSFLHEFHPSVKGHTNFVGIGFVDPDAKQDVMIQRAQLRRDAEPLLKGIKFIHGEQGCGAKFAKRNEVKAKTSRN